MRLFKPILIALISFSPLLAAPSACPKFYLEGEAPVIVNTKLLVKSKELCSSAYVVMHSGLAKAPLWSAEYLTREALEEKIPRMNAYKEDKRLSKSERSELQDYARSGYDRGHMAPSADMDTTKAQEESFLLSNMIPQDHQNNTGIWSSVESATRYLAKKEGALYVITGPIYQGKLKAIGNGVLVPTMIYKILYSPKQRKASAYLTDNAPGSSYKVISLKELEAISGINYFPKMSSSQKEYMLELPKPRMQKR